MARKYSYFWQNRKESFAGKSMTCCGGCLPKSNVRDLDRCPECGSRAIHRETIVHEV